MLELLLSNSIAFFSSVLYNALAFKFIKRSECIQKPILETVYGFFLFKKTYYKHLQRNRESLGCLSFLWKHLKAS